MKKLRIVPLILILVLCFTMAAPAAYAIEEPDITATTVVLADMETGEILMSKNADGEVSPASLTKIVTCLIAIEAIESGNCTLDEVIVAPDDCLTGLEEDSSTANIIPGEELTMESLLYCSLLGSANEACNILASHLAGSIPAFCEKMNIRCRELGCTHTSFVDPNGLSSDDKTTAYDFYLITKEAAKHELFMSICDTATYIVPVTNKAMPRTLNNSNALISQNSIYAMDGRYLYKYASGIKTGYTRAAGYCLISTAEKDGIRLINIVMGCKGPLNTGWEVNEYKNFADSIALYDWAFDNFSYQTIIPTSMAVYKADVDYARGESTVTLRPQNDIVMLVPDDFDKSAVELEIRLINDKLVAPIPAGTVLGTADVKVNGVVKNTIKLVNTASVELSRAQYLKQQIEAMFNRPLFRVIFVLLVFFAVAYIAMVIRYRSMRKKYIKEKRLREQQRKAERDRLRAEEYHITPDEPTQRFPKLDPIERLSDVKPTDNSK